MAGYVNRGTSAAALTRSQFLNIVASTITAFAGGGKASATPTTTANVLIGVSATAADSVLLPSPRSGDMMFVTNGGAAAAQLFGAGTATINGVATATGVSLVAGGMAVLSCFADGAWRMSVI